MNANAATKAIAESIDGEIQSQGGMGMSDTIKFAKTHKKAASIGEKICKDVAVIYLPPFLRVNFRNV